MAAGKRSKSLVATAPKVSGEVIQDNENVLTNHPIEMALKRFLCATDDYRDAVKMAIPAVADKRMAQLNRVQSRLKRFVSSSEEDGQ